MQAMKTKLIITILSLIFLSGFSNAAIQINPATTTTEGVVTVVMSGTLPAGISSMVFNINFNDGSPSISSPFYTVSGIHSFSTSHIFNQAGVFNITGTTTWKAALVAPPAPRIESRRVTIIAVAGKLSRGEVGKEYKQSLASASTSYRYRIIRGKLPPGLTLERNGRITGIPLQKGTFNSTVQITTQSGTQLTQPLSIYINPGQLIVRGTPPEIKATRGGGTYQKVTFAVVSPTVLIKETIRSTRGEFLAGGKVIGYNNRPLAIILNTKQPSASEKIKIPNSILRAAQDAGTSKITYRRLFKSQNLKSGYGEIRIDMRTAASGLLRITKLRIFFEQNNRPLILVERNSRDLTGIMEIHYNGSGLFKGYWKVDNRIIERIQKNIFYGKVLTLKTPNIPQLPTHSEGAHRLQFIVTTPNSTEQNITVPEAIYHVEAKRTEVILPIKLTAPENAAELNNSGETFTWTDPKRVSTYLVEFFETDAEEPFFTAYTKKSFYILPPKLLTLKFSSSKSYKWHIKGFNNENKLTAESTDRSFTLHP